jgi:hypothetical protein
MEHLGYNIPQERNAWTSNQSIFVFVTKCIKPATFPCDFMSDFATNWLMAAGLFRYFPYMAIYQFADN